MRRIFARTVFTRVLRLPHRGWMVDLTAEPASAQPTVAEFERDLQAFQAKYAADNAQSLWFKVPLPLSHVLPSLGREGFVFHHAEGSASTLLKWLRPDAPCAVPAYATHQVGVGGLVFNARHEVLVVKERNSSPAVTWKLPGGMANLGEDFGETAEREVLEETGVRSKYQALVTFRVQHGVAWGRSDIYAVCRLQAVSEEIQLDHSEIAECAWMPIARFLAEANPRSMIHYLLQRLHGRDIGALDIPEVTLPSIVYQNRSYKLYLNEPPAS